MLPVLVVQVPSRNTCIVLHVIPPDFCSNSQSTLICEQTLRHCRNHGASASAQQLSVPFNRNKQKEQLLHLSTAAQKGLICLCMKQKTGPKAQRSEKPSGAYLLDRLIVPRIKSFAQNNDFTDVDAVAEYLRGTYREYQRHKLGPFRSQVAKAVQHIQQQGGVIKTELQLQVPAFVMCSRLPAQQPFT